MTHTQAPWGKYLGWKVLPKDVVSDRIADDHNWPPVYLAADVDKVLEEAAKTIEWLRDHFHPHKCVCVHCENSTALLSRLRARARTQDEQTS